MQYHHLQSLEYLVFIQTSSHKKIGNRFGPQHIRQLQLFSQRKSEYQWMLWIGLLGLYCHRIVSHAYLNQL
jgi:hypothetical protein